MVSQRLFKHGLGRVKKYFTLISIKSNGCPFRPKTLWQCSVWERKKLLEEVRKLESYFAFHF